MYSGHPSDIIANFLLYGRPTCHLRRELGLSNNTIRGNVVWLVAIRKRILHGKRSLQPVSQAAPNFPIATSSSSTYRPTINQSFLRYLHYWLGFDRLIMLIIFQIFSCFSANIILFFLSGQIGLLQKDSKLEGLFTGNLLLLVKFTLKNMRHKCNEKTIEFVFNLVKML